MKNLTSVSVNLEAPTTRLEKEFSLTDCINREIKEKSYAFSNIESLIKKYPSEYLSVTNLFDKLENDKYLKSNNIFRKRAFGRFAVTKYDNLLHREYEPYYEQSNSYVGNDSFRYFPELPNEIINNKYIESVMIFLSKVYRDYSNSESTIEIGLHMLSITTSQDFSGEPTPEGMHQDGNNMFCSLLIERNCKGGKSNVYDLENKIIEERTMRNGGDVLIAIDTDLKHSVSEIYPCPDSNHGKRNVFIIDFYDPENLHKINNSSNISIPYSMLSKN